MYLFIFQVTLRKMKRCAAAMQLFFSNCEKESFELICFSAFSTDKYKKIILFRKVSDISNVLLENSINFTAKIFHVFQCCNISLLFLSILTFNICYKLNGDHG